LKYFNLIIMEIVLQILIFLNSINTLIFYQYFRFVVVFDFQ